MSITIHEITRNLLNILEKEGLRIHHGGVDKTPHTPAGVPLVEVLYLGEGFGFNHGEGPIYSVAEFVLKIALREKPTEESMVTLQSWVHRIREAVSPSSLNAGSLSATRQVLRVETKEVKVDHSDGCWMVRYQLAIRYRV